MTRKARVAPAWRRGASDAAATFAEILIANSRNDEVPVRGVAQEARIREGRLAVGRRDADP
jgi:hypothetical protein